MQKLRIVPWLVGIALILTTLVGANRLLHPTDPASGGGGGAPPSASKPTPSTDGLVAKGTVHSDPPTVAYTLPAHLQAGTVDQVKVFSGKQVKVGDELVIFSTALLQRDLMRAMHAYNTAYSEHQKALVAQKLNTAQVEKAKLAVAEAELNRNRAKQAVDLAKKALEKELEALKNSDGTSLTREQMEQRRAEDMRIFQANALADAADIAVKIKAIDVQLAELDGEKLKTMADQAAHQASAQGEDYEKAKQAIKDCTIRAKEAGIIEQVTATAGMTVYPQTQPLLHLVPSGKRVVWAEVVPEFAHKIKDRDGQKVTITDDSNTHLTYEGVVLRTRSAFLPKPNGAPDVLNGKANVVLIVEVEVTDPTPAGKPPLRVGQPVRVIFP